MDSDKLKEMLQKLDSGNIITKQLASCIRIAQLLDISQRPDFCIELAVGLVAHALNDHDLPNGKCADLFEELLQKLTKYVDGLELGFFGTHSDSTH